MRYFLDNVYCAYLAWFLIYQEGLLPTKVNILDIAAGPATVAYGLALLLQSGSKFWDLAQTHLSYYSLDKQDQFQYRGLQFWRRYIELQTEATNAYFRFDTTDIFEHDANHNKIPQNFFDFVVVSHCFFSDIESRERAHRVFRDMFKTSLKANGYVLLIIQNKKLFMYYNVRQSEDINQEQKLVQQFIAEMELTLVWYKYLSSTGKRKPMKKIEFKDFAKKYLPKYTFMNSLIRHYFELNFDLKYTLDDYVILAKR
jgi:hypothetical protein